MKKVDIKYIVTAVVVLIALGIFYKKVYIPKSTYKAYYPQKGKAKVEIFGVGELSAKDIYPVGASSSGKIINVFTDVGKYVKKGDILTKLDPVDLGKKLESSKLSLQKAEVELDSALKVLELAKSTYKKDKKLYLAKGLSKLSLQKVKTDFIVAQNKVTQAKLNIEEIKNTISSLEIKLDRLLIKSPIDGLVVEKNVEVGQSITFGYPLVKIVDPKTVWIKTWIDERVSSKIKVGQSAKITLRSRDKTPLDGKVVRIYPMSDPVTQEREVDVAFLKTPTPFYINEQAEVVISVKTFKGLYKIPIKYLVVKNSKRGVWIVKDSKAHFLPLDIVTQDSQYVGVKDGVDEKTPILLPQSNKKPLFEGSSISL